MQTPPPDPQADGDGASSSAVPTDAATAAVTPVDLRDYARVEPGEPTRTRVFATAALGVDLWCIPPRTTSGVLHEPAADVVYTVIGGRSWFVTDEGEVGLDPMGAVLVTADTVHGVENRSADPLILLATSSPPGTAEVDDPVASEAAAVLTSRSEGWLARLAARLGGGRPG